MIHSPDLLALIGRVALFVFPAGALWALLPLVARFRLGLGSAGYGPLLGCVGIGALIAAALGPRLRRRLTPRALYALACLLIAVAGLLLATTHSAAVAAVALLVAGSAWITGLGLLGAAYQGQLPPWVKARGLSYYLVAFQGTNAIGALALGGVAQASSVATALVVLAVMLLVAVPVTWRLTFPAAVAVAPAAEEPLTLPDAPPVENGPIAITVTYQVAPGRADAFLGHAAELRRTRRRTGATHWHLHRDLQDAGHFEELFVVGPWEEHERQHERLQGRDRQVLGAIDALLATGQQRTAHHWLAVRPRRQS